MYNFLDFWEGCIITELQLFLWRTSPICFWLASKHTLIFSFYVSVTWVKFVTCFYEKFFALAFIAWKKKKKKKKPTHSKSEILHGTRQWQKPGVMSSHGNQQESRRMAWPRLSDESLFSSVHRGSKVAGDILFQFQRGWAVGQRLQIITSSEITSYQKTARVRRL